MPGAELGTPHPWPVHSQSSAIHEFNCCSSPTSKMMSVRSFTWWGGRERLYGILRGCGIAPGCRKKAASLTFSTKV